MPIDYKKYHPDWKKVIRPAILERAGNKCEMCGVKNYAVGNWDGKKFIPTAGNVIHDAAGSGKLKYKDARQLVVHCNEWCDDNLIVIVLTIAHLDHDTNNNNFNNLKALCQRCHLRYDMDYHVANRKYGRKHKENNYKLKL